MMVFDTSIGKLRIRFGYAEKTKDGLKFDKSVLSSKGKRIYTFAEVSKRGDDGHFYPIACDFSICNPMDKYDKCVGRKLALATAMYQISTRSLRSEIWNNIWQIAGNHWEKQGTHHSM